MQLAQIFADNIVLQANKPIAIFGEGKGQIKIDFLGKTYLENSSKDKWVVYLDSCAYGGPYDMKIDLDDEIITLNNVMVGEVILCAGQSNMQFTIQDEKEGDSVKPNSNVRYFVSDRIEQYVGLHSKDGWTIANENSIKYFSALGYHIAEKIAEQKDVTVGIVGCFQGASTIRSWLDKASLTKDVFVPLEKRHEDNFNEYFIWNGDSHLYNHTFLPITPFNFGACVWYQGESNTTKIEGKVYGELLERLVYRYRKDLNDLGLTFVIVQISDYLGRDDDGWKAIQTAQEKATKKMQNAYFVESNDVCENINIHPSDKRALAERIAKLL